MTQEETTRTIQYQVPGTSYQADAKYKDDLDDAKYKDDFNTVK